jgi:hypothetical protein
MCQQTMKERASQRREALWPEHWFDRLAEKYHTPAAILERLLDPGDLHHEIARLIADAVIGEARELARASAQERIRKKRSKDWFDQLVVARWRQDSEKTEQKD